MDLPRRTRRKKRNFDQVQDTSDRAEVNFVKVTLEEHVKINNVENESNLHGVHDQRTRCSGIVHFSWDSVKIIHPVNIS
jgi:hypothetical protein